MKPEYDIDHDSQKGTLKLNKTEASEVASNDGAKCTPYDKVKNISFIRMDKWGNEAGPGAEELNNIRLSVFVTSRADSHHIQFREPIERHKLATLLNGLAESIRKGI